MKKDQIVIIKAIIVGSLVGLTTAFISKLLGIEIVIGGAVTSSSITSALIVKEHYK